MIGSRNCYFCKYYKDEYCENLELKPCYPQKGCEDFSKRMTRKEAIDIIKCLAWHTRPDEEMIEQAIKALEQEPIIDKIRAEIKLHQSDYDVHGTDYDRIAWKVFNSCLQIIDKYKAESEDK